MKPSCVAAVLTLWLQAGLAYNMFQQEIPNGDHVPHPCKPNYLWHGVGHKMSKGGGERNPFGQDFDAAGKVWNKTLCRKDSDGDGRTNGQELGDPDCVWRKGQTPPTSHNLSHPGICDPWDAEECVTKNSWLDCSHDEEFDCEYINDPEVRNITLRFPRTKVPAQETTYLCFNFKLPENETYHLIATKPYIDNRNVMHHLVLSGCDSSVQLLDEPVDCLMGNDLCNRPLSVWTLGSTGNCLDSQAGFLIGKGGSTVVSIQVHWTNPRKVDIWYDSSGLTLFYTPKLRQYNAGVLTIGQTYLSIPPGKSSWVHQGTCTARCTEQILQGDIHILSADSHMHYLGTRQNVTLKRHGNSSTVLADDNPYKYDNPQTHRFSPAIPMHPGDELSTICTFQSRSRAKTTIFGAGSYDEMCFAFISFFPAENVTNLYCMQWQDIDVCDIQSKCDYSIFNVTDPGTVAIIDKILANCDPAGSCRYECPAAIEAVREESPCIRNIWSNIRNAIYTSIEEVKLLRFAAAMDSCGGPDVLATTTTAATAAPQTETMNTTDATAAPQTETMNTTDATAAPQTETMNTTDATAAPQTETTTFAMSTTAATGAPQTENVKPTAQDCFDCSNSGRPLTTAGTWIALSILTIFSMQ